MKNSFKILLATDYSDAAMNAERYAIRFAEATKSSITFLHVYKQTLPEPKWPDSSAVIEYQIEKDQQEKLKQYVSKVFASMSVNPEAIKCEYVVQKGDLKNQIRDEAKKLEVDFIIVGTHGAKGVRETWFGSHAWDVMKRSGSPVIAIPENALYAGIKQIVFATEYREGELPVINFLTQIAKQFDAEVTVLHVTDNFISAQPDQGLLEKFRAEMKDHVAYGKLSIRLVHSDDIIAGLNDFCVRKNIDLLVMSPEKKFIWEKIFSPSITKRMSLHTAVPLVTIPDYYNPEYEGFWKMFEMDELSEDEF